MRLYKELLAALVTKTMPSKKAIPDRWTEYKALGKRMPGTRFVAFKVPLKQSLRNHLPQSQIFEPFDLLKMMEEDKQELGLIIDLTFTTRYYKLQDLPDSVLYLKIFTAGHEIPCDATVLSFKKAVRSFLRENQGNDKLIGVHCTHGLNRTGYLVCRYLIDVDGVEPTKAIELFNVSRGHSIERQNYLDDLKLGPKRSNVGMEEPDQTPVRGSATQRPSDPPLRQGEYYNHNSAPQRPHHRRSTHPRMRYGGLMPPYPFPAQARWTQTPHHPPQDRGPYYPYPPITQQYRYGEPMQRRDWGPPRFPFLEPEEVHGPERRPQSWPRRGGGSHRKSRR